MYKFVAFTVLVAIGHEMHETEYDVYLGRYFSVFIKTLTATLEHSYKMFFKTLVWFSMNMQQVCSLQ